MNLFTSKLFHRIETVMIMAALSISASVSFAASQPPPSGYTTSQLIFDETFTASTLDTVNWNPGLGDDVYGRWGNNGNLPSPYSGNNSGANVLTYFDPYSYGYGTNTTGAHLIGGGGVLRQIASPSSLYSSQGYTWASGAISSYGKIHLPATGGYVQFRAKMPDSSHGAWAGLWFMPSAGSDGHEFDLQESGFKLSGVNANNVLASHWWGDPGNQIIQNAGVDLSAAYHTYGVEYRPGQSWKVYLDGVLMANFTTNVSTNASYEIIIDLDMASSATSSWHTVSDASNFPGPYELAVENVQVYSLPPTNLVTNGSFESGLSPWTFALSGGAAGTRYDDNSTAANGTWSEAFQIWTAVSGCAYCAQLSQTGIALTAGKATTVTFSAKAGASRSIEVGLQKNSSPWTWYSLQTIPITTSWATYTFTFTPSVSDASARLNFNMGNAAGNVWIDNVIVTKVP